MPVRNIGSKEAFETKLCEALELPLDRVQRIIIDVQADKDLVQVYVQMVGDPDVLMKLDLPAGLLTLVK